MNDDRMHGHRAQPIEREASDTVQQKLRVFLDINQYAFAILQIDHVDHAVLRDDHRIGRAEDFILLENLQLLLDKKLGTIDQVTTHIVEVALNVHAHVGRIEADMRLRKGDLVGILAVLQAKLAKRVRRGALVCCLAALVFSLRRTHDARRAGQPTIAR